MSATNLTEVIERLRAFETHARQLSLALAPMLRRNGADAGLPHSVAGPLNRIHVAIADAVAVSGSALFDLTASLLLFPELVPAPPPPDCPEPIERVAKVAKRR
jgi:hypothetical protein